MRRVIEVALVAAVLLGAGAAAPAHADDAFGQHARQCEKTMGFDGVHNPGMHHGAAGWDPQHVC